MLEKITAGFCEDRCSFWCINKQQQLSWSFSANTLILKTLGLLVVYQLGYKLKFLALQLYTDILQECTVWLVMFAIFLWRDFKNQGETSVSSFHLFLLQLLLLFLKIFYRTKPVKILALPWEGINKYESFAALFVCLLVTLICPLKEPILTWIVAFVHGQTTGLGFWTRDFLIWFFFPLCPCEN